MIYKLEIIFHTNKMNKEDDVKEQDKKKQRQISIEFHDLFSSG